MHRDIEHAAKLHQAGQTKEALKLLQKLAKQHPSDPSVSVNYGLLLLESGNLDKARQRLRRTVSKHANYAPGQYAMGRFFIQSDRPQLASRHFKIASELEPKNISYCMELASSHQLAGKLDDAIWSAESALHRFPDDIGLLNFLAKLHIDNGNFDDAVKPLGNVAAIEPNNPVAHFNLAKALREQCNDIQAEATYRRALELQPNFAPALLSFGVMLKETGRLKEASLFFDDLVASIHGSQDTVANDVLRAEPPTATNEPVFRYTSAQKLDHDIQQLTYLLENKKIPECFEAEISRYTEVRNSILLDDGGQVVVPLSDEHFRAIGNSYHRSIFLSPRVERHAEPLNHELDVAALEASYLENSPSMVVVDDLLSPDVLQAIRLQCLESTYWYDYRHRGGYLGVGISEGFLSPLLVSIAENLRATFRNIFLDHPLRQAWAFKYDSRYRGTGIHADFAAINVNFWITPDEANLNPDGGGLVVYKHEAPMDWDFAEYNGKPEKIHEFLEQNNSQSLTVPHRQNRAVIFNSNLFHRTDDIDFRPGYENRRINITMLFGLRQYT